MLTKHRRRIALLSQQTSAEHDGELPLRFAAIGQGQNAGAERRHRSVNRCRQSLRDHMRIDEAAIDSGGQHGLERLFAALGRLLGQLSDEITNAVPFLASNGSAYVTGIELCVDGGWAQV